MKLRVLIGLLGLLVAAPVMAGDAPVPAPFADRMTGDWGGARSDMAQHGVTFDLDSTHFYQGLLSGTGDKSFNYGGRADTYFNFNTGKLGLWQGGLIRTHAEYRYDDLDSSLGGTLLPTNLGAGLPSNANKLIFTSIQLVQQLGDRSSVIIGKINTPDLLAADPFFGGYGVTRFQHVAFAAPLSGLTPPVIFGGILNVKTDSLAWTFMVYDPNNRPEDYLPDDLFDDGVNLAATAKRDIKLAGRSTTFAVSGIYSTKDGADLGDTLLPPELKGGTKKNSWHAAVQFSHFLREDPERPGQGLNFSVKAGVSDGNPNPFQSWVTGGIAGKGLFAARPYDTFGVGYFYYNFSDDLQDAVDPLVDFADEQGVEAYYNFRVAPGFYLSADVQYMDPSTGTNDKAFIAGIRAVFKL